MGEIAEAFRTGGVWMYLILALDLTVYPGCAIGLLLAIFAKEGTQRKILLGFTILIGLGALLILGVGVMGYMIGLAEVEAALEKASPENQLRLREMGELYAMYPFKFGLGSSIIPAICTTLMFGRWFSTGSND